jgi:molybdopterin-guanine dinucleotide biosynthesis protein A
MGWPKATLPFGPELMLQRVARLVRGVVGPLVVVAAPQQELPPLAWGTQVVRDRREGRGPLEGLCAGLEALRDRADAVFATSCDVPLLVPQVVRIMFDHLADHRIAVPVDGEFHHPLAAVYRTDVVPEIQSLLAADRLRPRFLFHRVRTRRVPVQELRDVDPDLQTLANLNRPADYLAAMQRAGFEVPAEVRRSLGL